jgi:hypothetical protein
MVTFCGVVVLLNLPVNLDHISRKPLSGKHKIQQQGCGNQGNRGPHEQP